MKYIIIGLGNYGGVLADELSVLGHEVIGVDTNEHRVDVLKDKIATSFIIDATDEQSLSVLPLKDVDVVIVAIGENFGASVRVVALLKKKGVKHIYARAVDDVPAKRVCNLLCKYWKSQTIYSTSGACTANT